MIKAAIALCFLSALCFLPCVLLASPDGKTLKGNMADERARVEQVIRDSIGWALDKDKEKLYGTLAQDEDFFIFHPDAYSTVIGFEPFKERVEAVFMSDDFKAVSFEVKKLRITFSRSGDVAWYSCLLDDIAEWKGRFAGWIDCRWTGVVENREGNWRIAQMHFSFPKNPGESGANDAEGAETEGKD